MQTIGRELKAKQETAVKKSARGADEHVAFELRTYPAAINKSERRNGNRILPTELRLVVMRARQHVKTLQRRTGSVRNVRRRPTQLLQIAGAIRRFDLLELTDATARPHDLHPAVV